MEVKKIRFPETSGIGIKPVSREGTERLVRAAIRYALDHKRKSVTLVHKGNIMKFTEGAFRDWGYALAAREFRDRHRERARELDPRKPGGVARFPSRTTPGRRARIRPDDSRSKKEVTDEVETCSATLWEAMAPASGSRSS